MHVHQGSILSAPQNIVSMENAIPGMLAVALGFSSKMLNSVAFSFFSYTSVVLVSDAGAAAFKACRVSPHGGTHPGYPC